MSKKPLTDIGEFMRANLSYCQAMAARITAQQCLVNRQKDLYSCSKCLDPIEEELPSQSVATSEAERSYTEKQDPGRSIMIPWALRRKEHGNAFRARAYNRKALAEHEAGSSDQSIFFRSCKGTTSSGFPCGTSLISDEEYCLACRKRMVQDAVAQGIGYDSEDEKALLVGGPLSGDPSAPADRSDLPRPRRQPTRAGQSGLKPVRAVQTRSSAPELGGDVLLILQIMALRHGVAQAAEILEERRAQ